MGRLYGTPLAGDTTTEFADTHAPDERSIATGFLDSIHLPSVEGEADQDVIVRPSLAILFRMAVGPGADHYAPRFLEYERTGRSFPSWNWAALAAPGVWAFYRRLWWAGIAFSAWPLAALAAIHAGLPHLGLSGGVALAVAVLFIWLIPGIVGALVADTLIFRKVRALVRYAESRTTKTDKAARWLSRCTVIAPMPAIVAAAVVIVTIGATVRTLDSTYSDQVVRARIADSIVAIRPLQRQVEAWIISRLPSDAPPLALASAQSGPESPEPVTVSLNNGRVRLALDPLGPELSGKSILLAPALDRRLQVHWICIPVDVPEKYLPEECRQG